MQYLHYMKAKKLYAGEWLMYRNPPAYFETSKGGLQKQIKKKVKSNYPFTIQIL